MSWSPRTPGSWVRIFTAVIVGVGLGLTAVPPFTTGAVAAGSFVSDDFFGGFEAGRWTVVDPSGDGKVAVVGAGTGDARLSIGVPAGSSHDAWRSNGSVRVLQAMGDTGFGVEAKFDSVPSGRYADQGLQVVGADGRWLRFGVYSDGSALRAFAATTTGTSSTTKISKVVAASGQMWLRVTRSGTTYSFGYSADGQSWATMGSFADGLAVTAVGPYAGNAGGSSAPAHTALVDYVFDTSAPVVPEDGGLSGGGGGGGGGADTTAPVVSGVAVQRADTSAKVTWSTNEQTTGRVEYGTTQSYGQLVRSGTSGTTHAVTLTGLTSSTTYHYRVVATDAAGNTATTVDATFTTSAVAAGPRIDLWHEGVLTVGAHGVTQPWVNVLGNMGDPAGITSASYRLNGGAPRSLSIGPDDRRLQDPGDFNADIAVSDLRLGDNTVTITATDGGGEQASITSTVRLVQVATPTIPYDQSWADGAPVQDQATVVDGRWRIQNGRLITSQLGYDRMVAIGDASWRDYVVEAPVTVHKIGPDAGGSPSGPALVGLALRWQGHTATNAAQPAWGFYPVGAYAWTRFFAGQPRVQIEADNGNVRQSVDTAPFQFGSDYRMKALVQTVSSSSTRYAFKMWLASAPEPSSWQVDVVARGPATGSIALIAHHVDASFGRVSVTPVPAA